MQSSPQIFLEKNAIFLDFLKCFDIMIRDQSSLNKSIYLFRRKQRIMNIELLKRVVNALDHYNITNQSMTVYCHGDTVVVSVENKRKLFIEMEGDDVWKLNNKTSSAEEIKSKLEDLRDIEEN